MENLRIETSGPSTEIGRTATLTREPSASRASTIGDDSSTRRPMAETILLTMRSRCASSRKRIAGLLEHAAALDEDALVRVDQNVVDRIVLEQRLDRPEPEHLVGRIGGELVELSCVERHVADAHELAHDRTDFVEDVVLRCRFERREVEPVDQMAVKLDLEGQKLVIVALSTATAVGGATKTGACGSTRAVSAGPLVKRPSIFPAPAHLYLRSVL